MRDNNVLYNNFNKFKHIIVIFGNIEKWCATISTLIVLLT